MKRRSIARYIAAPAEANARARDAKRALKTGKSTKWRV